MANINLKTTFVVLNYFNCKFLHPAIRLFRLLKVIWKSCSINYMDLCIIIEQGNLHSIDHLKSIELSCCLLALWINTHIGKQFDGLFGRKYVQTNIVSLIGQWSHTSYKLQNKKIPINQIRYLSSFQCHKQCLAVSKQIPIYALITMHEQQTCMLYKKKGINTNKAPTPKKNLQIVVYFFMFASNVNTNYLFSLK